MISTEPLTKWRLLVVPQMCSFAADISDLIDCCFCPQEEIGIETDEDYNVQPPDIWEGHAKNEMLLTELVVNKDTNTFCSLLTPREMYKSM